MGIETVGHFCHWLKGFQNTIVSKTVVFDTGHKKNLNHADRAPRLPLLATVPPLTHTSRTYAERKSATLEI